MNFVKAISCAEDEHDRIEYIFLRDRSLIQYDRNHDRYMLIKWLLNSGSLVFVLQIIYLAVKYSYSKKATNKR